MNHFISTLVLLAGLVQTASSMGGPPTGAYDAYDATQVALGQRAVQPPLISRNIGISSGEIGEFTLPAQAEENVLVVPAPDLPVESMADLTEDLTVMCRIFDKSVPSPRAGTGIAYQDRVDAFRYIYSLGQRSRDAQGLYLHGYGALFFVQVDYPLVPTEPQEPAQAKPKEPGDIVWSQTIREMTGQPDEERQTARNVPVYDPQKVENLKKTLIKTLAHASNIRLRRPQDVITLVVGALDDGRTTSYGRMTAASTLPPTAATTPAPAAPLAAPVPLQTAKPQPVVRARTAALLVLRVTKADVDAFAKGQLTLAQFTEKVQNLWTPAAKGTPASAPASSTGRRR